MTDNNDAQTINKTDPMHVHTKQMQIRMQHGEQAGQPIYSNFASVQSGQGVIIVDFGFLDPKTINALNQIAKSGEKMPDTIDARMSCRMAISVEAANNLAQQLNQLIHSKPVARTQAEQQDKSIVKETSTSGIATSDIKTSDEKTNPDSGQRGFKLPWSK